MDVDRDSPYYSRSDKAPPATRTLSPLLSTTPLLGSSTPSSSSSYPQPPRPTSSERPRRSREGFWRTAGETEYGTTPSGLVAVAPSQIKREKEVLAEQQDVEMSDATGSGTPLPALTTNKPISLVFRMPPNNLNSAEGSSSARSSPERHANGAASKKKRRSEPFLSTTRITRGRRSSPHPSTPQAGTSNETSPAPAGALSIFAPPAPSDALPEIAALQSALATTPTLTPTFIGDDSPPLGDVDVLRREAAAGFDSRLRPRVSMRDGGGERSGVSASGKGVRVGGTSRVAALQQAAQAAPLPRKKGKGKSGDVDVPNQDFCSACRGIGRFLCCDGCPRSFHFMCLEPPLRVDELPEEETWYCKECKGKRDREDSGSPSKDRDLKPIPSAFKKLYQKVDKENPRQYRLPDELKGYFQGVSETTMGEYLDTSETRPPKFDRKGFQEERDPLRTHRKSQPVQCYVCNGSSLPLHNLTTDPESTWRQIVSCDYCSLHWHLDCLTPPLASMPNSARKWMCPNHAQQVMPRRRTVARHLEMIDVDSPNMRNNGNIEILPEPEARLPQLAYEDMVINKKKFRVPERIIKLDFWEKLRASHEGEKIKPEVEMLDEKEEGEIPSEPPTEDDLSAANLILSLMQARQTPPPAAVPSKPIPSEIQVVDSSGGLGDSVEVASQSIPTPSGVGDVNTTQEKVGLMLNGHDNDHGTDARAEIAGPLATPVSAIPTRNATSNSNTNTSTGILETAMITPSKGPKIVLRMPNSGASNANMRSNGF